MRCKEFADIADEVSSMRCITIFLMFFFLLFSGLSAGCVGGRSKDTGDLHNSNCMWNYEVGRDYAAQGRFELAKEHLLMALAANSIPEMRDLIIHELKTVDALIITQR